MADKAKAFGLLLAIFAAGMLAGAVVDRAWMIHLLRRQAEAAQARERTGGQDAAERNADRIPVPLTALNLTPDEESRLHEIAARWRPQAGVLLDEMRRQVAGQENRMFAEMLCVLTVEQRARYLHSLQEDHYDSAIIDARFSLVRANQCGTVNSR